MLNRVEALKAMKKLPKKELLSIIDQLSKHFTNEIAQLKLARSEYWYQSHYIAQLQGKLAHYKAKEPPPPPKPVVIPVNLEDIVKESIVRAYAFVTPETKYPVPEALEPVVAPKALSFCEKVKDFLWKVYGKITSLF